jgi:hypothetical protein
MGQGNQTSPGDTGAKHSKSKFFIKRVSILKEILLINAEWHKQLIIIQCIIYNHRHILRILFQRRNCIEDGLSGRALVYHPQQCKDTQQQQQKQEELLANLGILLVFYDTMLTYDWRCSLVQN